MATAAQFRRLALALPDAVESAHNRHPDFRANGRIFAALHPDRGTAMVKLAPATQRRLVGAFAGTFAPANGAWGRLGCTIVQLAAVDAETLRDALADAWQQAMGGE